jgi:hypothetical protein
MKRMIALAGVLAAAGTVTAVVVLPSAAQATTPTCYAASLVPSYDHSEGTLGHLYDVWRLTNVSGHTCTLSGYPAVENYQADGRPLTTTTAHQGTAAAVTLAAGAAATFTLGYVDPGVLGCTPQHPAHMTIQPPVSTHPVLVSGGEPACGGQLVEYPLVHA